MARAPTDGDEDLDDELVERMQPGLKKQLESIDMEIMQVREETHPTIVAFQRFVAMRKEDRMKRIRERCRSTMSVLRSRLCAEMVQIAYRRNVAKIRVRQHCRKVAQKRVKDRAGIESEVTAYTCIPPPPPHQRKRNLRSSARLNVAENKNITKKELREAQNKCKYKEIPTLLPLLNPSKIQADLDRIGIQEKYIHDVSMDDFRVTVNKKSFSVGSSCYMQSGDLLPVQVKISNLLEKKGAIQVRGAFTGDMRVLSITIRDLRTGYVKLAKKNWDPRAPPK